MSLRTFFFPRHVALIGASREKHKVGYALARHLQDFSGRVSYVNRKGYRLFAKTCVPKVSAIVGKVDLAVIATPAATVPNILLNCAAKKITHIIILSAGFSESGEDALSADVQAIIAKHKLRVIGPNCFGLVNTANKLDLTFANTFPAQGPIAFVAQSGALWSAIAERSVVQRFGFSSYFSLGNMYDVDFLDALQYYAKDAHTKVIVCYIETLHDTGREFMRVVQSINKPVIVLKGGISSAGSRAALSHTGSLAGSSTVYEAALRQCGCYVTNTISETFDLAQFLSLQPRLTGKRVVVVTNAGGPSIVCADLLAKNGLDVVALPKNFSLPKLPAAWSHNNPMDIVGDADPARFAYTLSSLTKKKFYDAVLVLYAPQQMGDPVGIAKAIVAFAKKSRRPVIACYMGERTMAAGRKYLLDHKIPCFFEAERAVRVLSAHF